MVVTRVAIFEKLGHAAGWPFCLVRLHYRFMFHGIERLVEGVQFRDAEAIQNLSQNAVGGGNSLDQSVCLSRSRVGRAGFDGTPQIVDDLQQLAGKVRDRVLLRVLLAPFPLAPGILGLCERPHQPLAQGGIFGCEIVADGSTSLSMVLVAMSCSRSILRCPTAWRQGEALTFQDAIRSRGSTSSNSASKS